MFCFLLLKSSNYIYKYKKFPLNYMKVCIIGAGPAGNYSAYLLAKKGHSVFVFEKKKEIGRPIQCSGILSEYFLNFIKPKKEFIENTIERTRIYSPNGKYVETKIKKNYIISRYKFDNYLAELAKKQGVKYFQNHSFKRFSRGGKTILIELNNNGKTVFYKCDVLIGADGPLSPVAKAAGLFEKREYVVGTQVQAYLENDKVVEFYPYIGCYAWIIPINKKVVRIGVSAYKNSPKLFRGFIERKIGKNYKKKIIENQSGIIPVFNPKLKLQQDNIYLIGDAGALVKATSGGGINQSLKAATLLANCIEEKKDYNKEVRKYMFFELKMHLVLHNIMKRFNEKDWNKLIEIFSNEKMKKILYDESRDKVTRMILKIGITNPFLLRYLKYFSLEELTLLFS